MPDAECCFRLSSEGYEGSLALRLSAHRGEAILPGKALENSDSILIEGNSPSSFLLTRIGLGENGGRQQRQSCFSSHAKRHCRSCV